ncbi:hypothetical protein J1N35_033339 [Gossypium stocksii]|uniref:Cysteine proteinase inhibitor n=1 Tax=Gossypium stocksii TaxID=47602 RepID=A0A9D3UQS3_9ROSI|nr:hypothetical protein J1N35_033339 [Gossypium stocksii]
MSILFYINLSAELTLSLEPMSTSTTTVTLGGGSAINVEHENVARFAIDEHKKREKGTVVFARVDQAAEQLVVGRLHHLTVEAIDAGEKKLYEAKVWVKPWSNFKELQEFKHAGDAHASPSSTTSDLVVHKGSSLLKFSSNSYCRKLSAFQKRKKKKRSLYLIKNTHTRGYDMKNISFPSLQLCSLYPV